MIVVACLLDREAFPWQADWYRARVQEHLGAEPGEQFRLWFVDNALHGDDDPQEFPARSVTYVGALEAALRQLAAWVEHGIEPSPTSAYHVVDGQIVIPDTAADRGGIQPVVDLTVNGETSTTVRVGQNVTVRLEAETPGVGVLVETAIDLTGSGDFDETEITAIEPSTHITTTETAFFATPGTYFIAARVIAQVDGDASLPFARVHNVARARVTVTA